MKRRRVLTKRVVLADGRAIATAISIVVLPEEEAIAHQSVQIEMDATGGVTASSSSTSCTHPIAY